MLSPFPEKRQEMIRRALQEKAPKTYLQLQMQGKLQEFLESHDEAMMEAYDPMSVALEAADRVGENDPLRQVQEANQAVALLDEQTLATWLEFSDPPIKDKMT